MTTLDEIQKINRPHYKWKSNRTSDLHWKNPHHWRIIWTFQRNITVHIKTEMYHRWNKLKRKKQIKTTGLHTKTYKTTTSITAKRIKTRKNQYNSYFNTLYTHGITNIRINVLLTSNNANIQIFQGYCIDSWASHIVVGEPQFKASDKFLNTELSVPQSPHSFWSGAETSQSRGCSTAWIKTPEKNSFVVFKTYIAQIDVLFIFGMDVIHEFGLFIAFQSNCLTSKQQIWKLLIEYNHGHA